MTQKETLEGNILILKFMGYDGYFKTTDYENGIPVAGWFQKAEELSFNTSWDCLIPVVEKINEISILEVNEQTGKLKMRVKASLYGIGVNSDIKSVWKAIVDFIKWYNKEKND